MVVALAFLTLTVSAGSTQARAPGDEVLAACQTLSDSELQQVRGKFALTLYYPPDPVIFRFAPDIHINFSPGDPVVPPNPIIPPNLIRSFFRPINITITHANNNPT
jgi:hypothetical protein